jgi:TM2 domain-containing membrane protein YozV
MNERKSTGLAAVLSFLVPGLGHWYVGRFGTGTLLMLVWLVIGARCTWLLTRGYGDAAAGYGVLVFAIVALSAKDAYRKADEFNRHPPSML